MYLYFFYSITWQNELFIIYFFFFIFDTFRTFFLLFFYSAQILTKEWTKSRPTKKKGHTTLQKHKINSISFHLSVIISENHRFFFCVLVDKVNKNKPTPTQTDRTLCQHQQSVIIILGCIYIFFLFGRFTWKSRTRQETRHKLFWSS